MIEIYTQPGCRPCAQNKAWMDKNDIAYVVKDVTDPAVYEEFKKFNMQTVPVLKKGNDIWTGFNPVKLRELVA